MLRTLKHILVLTSFLRLACGEHKVTIVADEDNVVKYLVLKDRVYSGDSGTIPITALNKGNGKCVCKYLCHSTSGCGAYSISSSGNCTLIAKPVNKNLFENDFSEEWAVTTQEDGAMIVFMGYENLKVTSGREGYTYFLSAGTHTRSGCVEHCSSFPGFRLAITNTEKSLDDIRGYHNRIVDLGFDRETNTFIWGDGSVLDPSILEINEPVRDQLLYDFVIWLGLLNDFTNNPRTCLCQNHQYYD